jgi:hypothetical protein
MTLPLWVWVVAVGLGVGLGLGLGAGLEVGALVDGRAAGSFDGDGTGIGETTSGAVAVADGVAATESVGDGLAVAVVVGPADRGAGPVPPQPAARRDDVATIPEMAMATTFRRTFISVNITAPYKGQ